MRTGAAAQATRRSADGKRLTHGSTAHKRRWRGAAHSVTSSATRRRRVGRSRRKGNRE
ncbi:hypothetical protein [Oryza sativa Japonica Group]|uniref:Uncharacterized protein n=1 Tax=Oryza sativa subsp. japonica TaxID=39947 RepID=Q5Z8B0_ORYSJ|nr:hypothetical protein [Oryza sativa Japonica Group]BAD53959.1 hypothetical protein [Oryza sativa Japonica Group]